MHVGSCTTKGACVYAAKADASPRTLDGCDPKTGSTHAPLNTGCDDQNVCTAGDHCVEGKCLGSLSYDDGNSCTADACDFAQQGCVHLAVSATCSDSNPCTADTCDPATGCVHQALADGLVCGSGKACTSGLCL